MNIWVKRRISQSYPLTNRNFMTDISTTNSSISENERDSHYDRIHTLRKACEMEMFSYIKKYILNGHDLNETFSIAHKSVVNCVNLEGYVYGHYVLEHIIEYEEEFSKNLTKNELYKAVFKSVTDDFINNNEM